MINNNNIQNSHGWRSDYKQLTNKYFSETNNEEEDEGPKI